MVAGVSTVNSSDIETRFDLEKSDLAVTASGTNIGFCVFVMFVAYFGGKWNKAKSIAISCGILTDFNVNTL